MAEATQQLKSTNEERAVLHVLSLRETLAGTMARSWDQSACPASLTPEKAKALSSNPFPLDESAPAQLICTRGCRVVGRMDLVAGELVVHRAHRQSRVPILWGSNLFVPPAERKSLVGAMLLMKAATLFPTVGAHGPSQLALPLYEKLAFAKIPLDRHILLRRSRSIARRYLGDGMTGRAASLVGDAGLLGLRGVNAARGFLSGTRLRRVPVMPDEFDATLRAGVCNGGVQQQPGGSADEPTTSIRCGRSVEWINWLLANSFGSGPEQASHRHERALFLLENRGRTPLGYILMKVRFHAKATHREFPDLTLATLADWGSFDGQMDLTPAITSAAIQAAAQLDADALEICSRPGESTAKMLRRFGFARAGIMNAMVKATSESALAPLPYTAPMNWTLRYGDGENVLG